MQFLERGPSVRGHFFDRSAVQPWTKNYPEIFEIVPRPAPPEIRSGWDAAMAATFTAEAPHARGVGVGRFRAAQGAGSSRIEAVPTWATHPFSALRRAFVHRPPAGFLDHERHEGHETDRRPVGADSISRSVGLSVPIPDPFSWISCLSWSITGPSATPSSPRRGRCAILLPASTHDHVEGHMSRDTRREDAGQFPAELGRADAVDRGAEGRPLRAARRALDVLQPW